MAITINGSGTITGVSAGGLPDGSVTNDDLATGISSSKLTGALPSLDGSALTNLPGGGKVLQVVTQGDTSTFTTTSETPQYTGLNVSITPSATSSKILILAHINGGGVPNSGGTGVTIYRDTTHITAGSAAGNRRSTMSVMASYDTDWLSTSTMIYLDSPSTTSATSYKIYINSRSGYTAAYNRTANDTDAGYTIRPRSTITVMEIGA